MRQSKFLVGLRKLIPISLPMVLAACPHRMSGRDSPSRQIPDSRSVWFVASQSARIVTTIQLCESSPLNDITGTWTPSNREVRVLDRSVRDQLQNALQGQPFGEADYFIQYFGVIDSGRRMILINGFHEVVNRTATTDTTAWRRGSVLVCDSGWGAFQADYNVEAKQLSRIRFFSSFEGKVN